tara:strand:+ start:120 stop:557 length:438 start_codon:yes stop_codon:yes gene_type:complete
MDIKNVKLPTLEKVDNKKELKQLNNLYFNKDKNDLLNFIKKKISGYKQQDIKKNKLDKNNFINFDKTVELLVISKLKCFYCNRDMKIKYENCRDKQQWTLDRIDNDLGHNNDNVKIACLDCNLKRRRINMEKFVFTKQLKINKHE